MKKLLVIFIATAMISGCNMKFWQSAAFTQTISGVGSVVLLLDEYDETRTRMIADGTKACVDGLFNTAECKTFKDALLKIDRLVDTIRSITRDEDALVRIGAVGDLSIAFNDAQHAYREARAIVMTHFDALDIDTQRRLQTLDADARTFARAMTAQFYTEQDDGFNLNKAIGIASRFAKAISKFAVLL